MAEGRLVTFTFSGVFSDEEYGHLDECDLVELAGGIMNTSDLSNANVDVEICDCGE